jgi:hypothetical protein
MGPKAMSTISIVNRQTPTKFGFGFDFMWREADFLQFLIIHKKQKSQYIDSVSTYKESKDAKILLQFALWGTNIVKIKGKIRNERVWERTQKWFEWFPVLIKHHWDCILSIRQSNLSSHLQDLAKTLYIHGFGFL